MVLTSEMGTRRTARTSDGLNVATKPCEVTGTPLFQPQPKKSPQAGAVLCACGPSNFLLPLPRKIRIGSLWEITLGALSFHLGRCLFTFTLPKQNLSTWSRSVLPFQHLPQRTRLSSPSVLGLGSAGPYLPGPEPLPSASVKLMVSLVIALPGTLGPSHGIPSMAFLFIWVVGPFSSPYTEASILADNPGLLFLPKFPVFSRLSSFFCSTSNRPLSYLALTEDHGPVTQAGLLFRISETAWHRSEWMP